MKDIYLFRESISLYNIQFARIIFVENLSKRPINCSPGDLLDANNVYYYRICNKI